MIEYMITANVMFLIGLSGIYLNRKNILILLMSIELMLLAINTSFILFSILLDDVIGQIFALFILTIAAAESSIGLAILVVYYRVKGSIKIENIYLLKG